MAKECVLVAENPDGEPPCEPCSAAGESGSQQGLKRRAVLCREDELSRTLVRGTMRSLSNSSFLFIVIHWPDSEISSVRVPLHEIEHLNPVTLCAFLEDAVRSSTGLATERIALRAMRGCESLSLPDLAGKVIDAHVLDGGTSIRYTAAIRRAMPRFPWLTRLRINGAIDDALKPDLIDVECEGAAPSSGALVLKLAPGSANNSPEAAGACAWPELRHPSILTVLCTAGPSLFFFTVREEEACSDACVWLRECPAVALLPHEARQAVVVAIAAQIAAALEYTHSAGAVHLDVKPAALGYTHSAGAVHLDVKPGNVFVGLTPLRTTPPSPSLSGGRESLASR
ncbi:hypothetical protein T484DRAFT_1833296 [Baffinella frigidus]|nr:hypothetical protein T484DRAFT_1833296 [Cryptophyta sp. CCMP2293]